MFGEQFWRPYVHARDAARAVADGARGAGGPRARGEVFNVGDTTQNYQKQQLVELIKPHAPDATVEYVRSSEDPRDYRVSFTRIADRLGYKITTTVPAGIAEVARLVESRRDRRPRRREVPQLSAPTSNASRPGAAAGGFTPLCVPELRGNEWEYVKECLDTNWVSSVGSYVDRFERVARRAAGTRHAVATTSGTAALHVALLLAGVERGRRSAGVDAHVHRTGERDPLCGRLAGIRRRGA